MSANYLFRVFFSLFFYKILSHFRPRRVFPHPPEAHNTPYHWRVAFLRRRVIFVLVGGVNFFLFFSVFTFFCYRFFLPGVITGSLRVGCTDPNLFMVYLAKLFIPKRGTGLFVKTLLPIVTPCLSGTAGWGTSL